MGFNRSFSKTIFVDSPSVAHVQLFPRINQLYNVKELLMKPNQTTQPAFSFTIQFPDEVIKPDRKPDIVFREISGIATEITTETMEEGGLQFNQ